MNNPDERTAVDQFGEGDKYFGVATMMATLPGLPMFGHGQIEGFAEKYGMEFRRRTLDETPNEWLVGATSARSSRCSPAWRCSPRRDFALYDFVTDDGGVDENVFAYSNGATASGARRLQQPLRRHDRHHPYGRCHWPVPGVRPGPRRRSRRFPRDAR